MRDIMKEHPRKIFVPVKLVHQDIGDYPMREASSERKMRKHIEDRRELKID